jgi:hypothetical protein
VGGGLSSPGAGRISERDHGEAVRRGGEGNAARHEEEEDWGSEARGTRALSARGGNGKRDAGTRGAHGQKGQGTAMKQEPHPGGKWVSPVGERGAATVGEMMMVRKLK